MKIAQIGTFPENTELIKGGVQASVFGLSNALLTLKHEVYVYDLPHRRNVRDYFQNISGIHVQRYHSAKENNLSSLKRIFKVVNDIKKSRPDICHIHSTSLYALGIYLILKLNGLPVLVTVHGLAHIEKKNVLKGKKNLRNRLKYFYQSLSEFLLLDLCKFIIVDTQYVSDEIRKYKCSHKIISLPKCIVIPQGINHAYFEIKTPQEDINNILSVGAIGRRKGHLQLIEAFAKLADLYPAVTLTIAGVVVENDYKSQIINKISELSLSDKVRLYIDRPIGEIIQLYRDSTIFALHTQEESQGIVFCEAMAAGKPIVATNVGGVPWVVENHVNGLLSDYGDIDTFVANMISLLKDDKLRDKMSEINKDKSRMYDWRVIAKEIITVYEKLIRN